jgi:hypothetical protein
VYCWRLLLEEYAPKIVHIKGIHNTVADAILQLEYDPMLNKTNEYTHAMLGVEPEELSVQRWISFAHHWRSYNETAEILGDPYSKKSPLPSVGTSPRLAIYLTDTSYRLLGQARNTTHHNHPPVILAQ